MSDLPHGITLNDEGQYVVGPRLPGDKDDSERVQRVLDYAASRAADEGGATVFITSDAKIVKGIRSQGQSS